ncbi:MAG: hypothetical protein H7Y17_15835 [Chlorobia bacterium]|nr:hypothetical protein [Fimbriimonadaceae bacterium]
MRIVRLFLACIVVSTSFAQGKPPENPEVIKAMKETAFLVGEWHGEGWMMIGGKRETSKVVEKIALKAGGSVLSLEGRGLDSDGNVIHDAFGILYYDPATKEYRMRSFLAGGASGEHKATAKNGVIVWTMQNQRTIRYTIKLDEKSRWHEIGEVDLGEGKWYQFFEMRLKKVK